MSAFALALVLTAAVLHASWNVLAKRAAGGVAFIWLYFAIAAVLYLPVVAVALALTHPRFGLLEWLFVVGNGLLHVVYFVVLQRGYQVGDLSLVYPLARGTGPLLSSLAAIALFGEHPSSIALAGVALVVIAVFLASGHFRIALTDHATRVSSGYGLATGISIAAYTLWDKHAVTASALGGLGIPPIIYDFGGNMVRLAAMTPFVLGRGAELRRAWREYRLEAFGIATLSPLAYLLVLWALVFTPVSLVAPARELSILIGTFLGVRLFGERHGRVRLAAAALMLVGIVALAHG